MTFDVNRFKKEAEGKVLIAGYGSLLSEYSRFHYSQIDSIGLPVIVNAWERAWITRSMLEQQTYAGAIANSNKKLSAQLISLNFGKDFQSREQDYQFTRIPAHSIELDAVCLTLFGNSDFSATQELKYMWQEWLAQQAIYICETLLIEPSTEQYPVNYSYLNTCVQGSYEAGGIQSVEGFFETTSNWRNTYFCDDLELAKYPRGVISVNHGIDLSEQIKKYQ